MLTKTQARTYMRALPDNSRVPRDSNTSSTYITKIEFLEYVESLEQSVNRLVQEIEWLRRERH